MQHSQKWLHYFRQNLQQQRINWNTTPTITPKESQPILPSLQAWQLGETSEGSQLVAASIRYAKKINDPYYTDAIRLFIKEEQKHGHNLGKYLDLINEERIQQNWGDSLFRSIRHLNNSMQWWTLTVITVECTAQIFYQCIKDASHCPLLKQICTDILIDEAPHIRFQQERLQQIYANKNSFNQWWSKQFYRVFYWCTTAVVWQAHQRAFKAGGVDRSMYLRKMAYKYQKTIGRLGQANPSFSDTYFTVNYQRKQPFSKAILHSFDGIRHFFAHERNGQIQLLAGTIAIACGIAFKLEAAEWLAVLICTGMVISLEMVNTSLEQLCNKVEATHHPAIKIVKDIAAGAVLFASLISIIMAAIIFLPKMM
jgi:diacylglycerol kinase